jgi:heme/copper-type cytochrome/quinol oxidase subunit 2
MHKTCSLILRKTTTEQLAHLLLLQKTIIIAITVTIMILSVCNAWKARNRSLHKEVKMARTKSEIYLSRNFGILF